MPAQRTCIGCRRGLSKADGLRLVVDSEGRIWPDLLQKAPGRGAYLCMDQACLQRMSSKRLGVLRGKFPQLHCDWPALRERIRQALRSRIAMIIRSLRGRAFPGRDAVMQRMWNNAPQVVLLARDAGEALQRQIAAAVEKRRQAGLETKLLHVGDAQWLGEQFARERLAVVSLDDDRQVAGLVKNCAWLERLEGIGV